MDLKAPVTLSARSAPLAVIDGKVVAVLLPMPPAAEWNFIALDSGNGSTYRIQHAATGNFLAMPEGYDDYAQAEASSSSPDTPNSIWRVTELEEEDGPQVSIQLADSGNTLGRGLIEDKSLMPKRVYATSRQHEFIGVTQRG